MAWQAKRAVAEDERRKNAELEAANTVLENEAATTLQTLFRSRKARKAFRKLKAIIQSIAISFKKNSRYAAEFELIQKAFLALSPKEEGHRLELLKLQELLEMIGILGIGTSKSPAEVVASTYASIFGSEVPSSFITPHEFYIWWIRGADPSQWETCSDEKGETFYYNSISGESVWDEPRYHIFLNELADRAALNLEVDKAMNRKAETAVTLEEAETVVEGAETKAVGLEADNEDWQVHEDESGNTFYFNPTTNTSQWDKPEATKALMDRYENAKSKKDAAIMAFDEFDTDQSGYISMSELRALLTTLGQNVSDEYTFAALGAALDTTGDGSIDKEEFVQYWVNGEVEESTDWEEIIDGSGVAFYYNKKHNASVWEKPAQFRNYTLNALLSEYGDGGIGATSEAVQAARNAFAAFDADHTGSIDASELVHLCTSLGQSLADDELTQLLEALDTNGDGSISLEEFTSYWSTGSLPPPGTEDPAEWQEHMDESGTPYFYNLKRCESTWEKPRFHRNNETLLSRYGNTASVEEAITFAFTEFDKDGTGEMDKFELGDLITALDRPMSPDQLAVVMETLDISGDGRISLAEFSAYWTSGTLPEDPLDWSEHTDGDGNQFYYNMKRCESMWQKPRYKQNVAREKQREAAGDSDSEEEVDVQEYNETTFDQEPKLENTQDVWETVEGQDGSTYYYNTSTGETAWEIPGDKDITLPVLPARWEEVTSDDGSVYYYNSQTGDSQYEFPE